MESVQDHPYSAFLHAVEKPVRYIGGEHGTVKKDWSTVKARVALAFPDLYDIGMSHLGFKILYGILNDHPSTLAERVYAPWTDMEEQLRKRNLPLVSLESARALRDFDVVGFSLQFELTFTNILLMLDLGGIPLRSADRTEEHPLVIAGGPTATHPEPLAPFFDAIVIGDGERLSVEIALLWAALRDAKMPRAARLKELAKLEGVYVPSLYETAICERSGLQYVARPTCPEAPARVTRAFIGDLNQYPFPSKGPVAATETVFDRISVEIARGCTEGCRFCQAGMIYRPVRERDPQSIIDTITSAVREGGYDEASLTCLSTADYSCIAPLIKAVMDKLEGDKVSLSVSSLRAYGLDEEILDDLQRVRATGLTFAPEAGTQRMRDVVNKNVTEEQLMTTAHRVFSRGWSKMKLYFMIGLPTEQDVDVMGIIETGRKAQEVGRSVQKGKRPDVTVSVSTHVPKPHTPFQWCAMDTLEEITRKQRLLLDCVRPTRVSLRLHKSHGSLIEAVLARGDRRLAPVLEWVYLQGARFDSWEDKLRYDLWMQGFEKFEINTKLYMSTIPTSAKLPWDHIDVGLEDGFLLREYRKALADRLSPPCGKPAGMFVHHTNLDDAKADQRKLVCYDCGVACDLTEMREERFVFLERLTANSKRVRAPMVERDVRKPRVNFVQEGEPRKLRLAFERVGRAAFQGHLDLVRVVPRVFRRAQVNLWYSLGFHPKPDLVFGPALALGIATLHEYVDVKLAQDINVEGLCALLQLGAPEGLTFTDAALLTPDDPGLNKLIEHTEYVAAVPHSILQANGVENVQEFQRRIDEARAAGLSTMRSVEKGLARRINVGEYVLEVQAGEGADALAKVGYAGALVPVRFVTRVTPNGTCKPSEVLRSVLGVDVEARYVRTRMGRRSEDGSWAGLLDLAKFRRVPKAATVKDPVAERVAERVEAVVVDSA